MALSATDYLIGKLATIIEKEATDISGVRHEVDKITLELLSMKAFLEDAEAKKELTDLEKLSVTTIRDLAYDIEDIIDEFMYHMYEEQSGGQLSRVLHKTTHVLDNLLFRRKIGKKLQAITDTIKSNAERNQRYGFRIGEGTSNIGDTYRWVMNQVDSSFLLAEDELVGIEDTKKVLMRWLMDDEQQQTVVSVVGMGGSGKTTLVAKAYTNDKVKRHFNCYAWITVSQTYVIADLFRSLIRQLHKSRKEEVPADLNAMSQEGLRDKLVDYLESKRYLVVVDDVWDIKLWNEVSASLLDNKLGSRIILTTRKEDISEVGTHVHHIQPLKKNDAWELFRRKAFSTNHDKDCPPEVESLARELVEKCEGLPLAVVALGSLMSSKKTPDQWKRVCMTLNWHFNNVLLNPVKSLMLSFNDLPSQLKHCFLYCSLFPEDYPIARKRLIRLWIAEGFVEHVKGVTQEELADGYLMELCFRSMLQVVERNESGRPKQVKMHDLMRELALSISEKEKFGHVYDGKEVMEKITTRRLAIHTTGDVGKIKFCTGMSKIRSLLIFTDEKPSLVFLNTYLSRFKLLRSLDLEDLETDDLPTSVVYLFNLRYLNLKGTSIKKLPMSVGRLRNLLFLNIKESKILSLPRGITELLDLRHLIVYRYSGRDMGFKFNYVCGTKVPSNIGQLLKLQSLSMIESEGNTVKLVGNMTQLRRLGMSNVKEGDEIDLWLSISKLTLLHSLELIASSEDEFLPLAQCPPLPHLRHLSLSGRLQKVLPWFSTLHSLTTLLLHWSRLKEDILPQVEALPNLTTLCLSNAYVGDEWCFRRGFSKLLKLELLNFSMLKMITIQEGAMPNLQELSIFHCMRLRTVPLGVENLCHLQTFELISVPAGVLGSMRPGGEARAMVQHIPEIKHYGESSSGWVVENLV